MRRVVSGPRPNSRLFRKEDLTKEHLNMSIMKVSRSAGFLSALFASAMLTAALMGILFFAWRVAGLPFVPFDVFDRTTRVLPGRLIAFGIGTMVTVIRA